MPPFATLIMPSSNGHCTTKYTDISAEKAREISENANEWADIVRSIHELAEDGVRNLVLTKLSGENRDKLLYLGFVVTFIANAHTVNSEFWLSDMRFEVRW